MIQFPQHDRPLALLNARLIDPATGFDQHGGIFLQEGVIKAFGPSVTEDYPFPEDSEILSCDGNILMPGLIDMRAELREPGGEHLETLESAAYSAIAGGITSVCCMPNTNPVIDDMSLVESILRRAREIGLVRILPLGAATKGLKGQHMAEIGLMSEVGAVAFTNGLEAIADSLVTKRLMAYAHSFDLLLMQHPEDPALASGGHVNESEYATRLGLTGIPVEAEAILLERDIRLVRLTNVRYHAAHISTAEAVKIIAAAKQEGLPVTCDTAPPYFALNEVHVGNYLTFAKMSPPLRSEQDRQAIVQGLKEGIIDAVASDHSPHDVESKRQPFAQADAGAVGLETLLPLLLEQVHNGSLDLLSALKTVTSGPAKILRLPQGHLSIGAPADVITLDLHRAWKLEAHKLRSKCRNTPFDGKPLEGIVTRTIVAGKCVFDRANTKSEML